MKPLDESPMATRLPLWQWIARITIVAVEVVLAYWCSMGDELFFYQGF